MDCRGRGPRREARRAGPGVRDLLRGNADQQPEPLARAQPLRPPGRAVGERECDRGGNSRFPVKRSFGPWWKEAEVSCWKAPLDMASPV